MSTTTNPDTRTQGSFNTFCYVMDSLQPYGKYMNKKRNQASNNAS